MGTTGNGQGGFVKKMLAASITFALAISMIPLGAAPTFATENAAADQQLIQGSQTSAVFSSQKINIEDKKYTFYCEDYVTATGATIDFTDKLTCFVEPNYEEALFYKQDFVDVAWHTAVLGNDGWVRGASLQGVPAESGTYFVELHGIGNCTGVRYVRVQAYTINDLCGFRLSSRSNQFDYPCTGEPIALDFNDLIFRDMDFNARQLKEGDDFVVEGWYASQRDAESKASPLGSTPSDPGDYFVRIEGRGSYAGWLVKQFSIVDSYDLTGLTCPMTVVLNPGETFAFPDVLEVEGRDGSTLALKLNTDFVIGHWSELIEQPGHYWVSGPSFTKIPSSPGRYQAVLNGTGSYSGQMRMSLDVWASNDIERFEGSFDFLPNVFIDGDTIDYARCLETPTGADKTPLLAMGEDFAIGSWHRVILDGGSIVGPAVEGAPTEGGRYYLSIVGTGAYMGTAWIQTTLCSRNDFKSAADQSGALSATITDDVLSFDRAEFCTPGLSGNPVVWKKDVDFSVDESAWYASRDDAEYKRDALEGVPTSNGTYYLAATGINGREGKGVLEVKVTVKPAASASVVIGGVTYTANVASGAVTAAISPKATSATVRSSVKVGGKAYKINTLTATTTKGCSKLKSLTLAEGIDKIAKGALAKCTKLKTVTVWSGKLTKSQLANLLKGSKVTTVKLAGKAAKAKKASYTKWAKGVRNSIKVRNA